jgi:iron complex transport system ATP-binding protein
MTIPLRIRDLTAGYRTGLRERPVLSGLNLAANAGELVCLLGPNGVGKTTLLRTIGKIQPALSGSIEIAGFDIQQMRQHELARQLGIVLTDRPVVGALPVHRVVELGRYPHVNWLGQISARDRSVVHWALSAVSAEHLALRDTRTLSDGEHQRVMIARALAQEPSVLLLDEPTAYLDVPSRVQLMGLLRRLAREQRLAIVVSTHDLELALRMADTIWLAGPAGEFYLGTPEDIVLEGRFTEAFSADSIRFHPEERAFRPVAGTKGGAVVQGEGLHAILAAAVLEREGYEIVAGGTAALVLSIAPDSTDWALVEYGRRHQGRGFAALAALARDLPPVQRRAQR